MQRRKIVSELEARRVLAELASTGVEIREWSRTNGVDGRSLHAWRMILARQAGTTISRPRRRNEVVELVPTPTARSVARYAMRVADVELEFGDDASEATLKRVLTVLRSC